MSKQKKKSSVTINGKILRQVLRENWLMFAGVALVLCVSYIMAFSQPWAWLAKYTPEEAMGGEMDFTAPDIIAHTAEDGVIVITMPEPLDDPQPARVISDPADIWETETSPTHGGFTLPVEMDDESIGVLTIPGIDLSVRVYESGDQMEDMLIGAAHFPSTSAWYGNVGLSAHNVNFDGSSGYFLKLYTLNSGDVIFYQTAHGRREYIIETIIEICEYDWSYLDRTTDNRITLITCITGRPELRPVVQAIERHP